MLRGRKVTPELRREAARLARGRTRREVADELGIGLSSLRRWIGRGVRFDVVGPLRTVDLEQC